MEPYMQTEYRLFFASTNSKNPIWELYVDDIELLAGMLAGGIGIMDDLNASSNSIEYYIDSDADVSTYRLLNDVPEEMLRSSSVGRLGDNEYGIWLKGSKRFVYSLYVLKTNKFFQGIVSICNAFQVDFRNYLYGFPFDKYGNQYALSGYVMAPNLIAVDAPDIDDIEEEEEDDENINQPLTRTDEIYNLTSGFDYTD